MSREVDSTWSPPKKDYLYDPMKLLEVLPGDSQVEPQRQALSVDVRRGAEIGR